MALLQCVYCPVFLTSQQIASPLPEPDPATGFFLLRGAFPSRCCQVFTHTGLITEVFSFFLIYLEVTVVLIWWYINTTELKIEI